MSKPAFWVSRVPVLSTAHISRQTMDWLIANPGEHDFGAVASYAHGVFMQLKCGKDAPTTLPDIQPLQRWIKPRHYHWIRLDADGDVVPGLPVHDW